jgi:hypothetical protein
MLVDGRMLAYPDLGEPTGPVAMYFHVSTVDEIPRLCAGLLAASKGAAR